MIDRCKFLHNLPCEQVSDRIVELEEENANLMETVDEVMPSLIEDNARLKVENAKLRSLVRDLERAKSALCDEYPDRLGVDCEECPANFICDADPAGRARELKIEVKS